MTRFVHALVPKHVRDAGPDTARRGRMVVSFVVIITVAAASYAVVYIGLGMPIAAGGALLAVALSWATAALFRVSGWLRISGHGLGLAAFCALVGVTLDTGGIGSPATAWFSLAAIIPALILGRTAGVGWMFGSIGWFVTLYALDLAGAAPTNALPGPFFVTLYDLIVPAGLVLAIYAIAWSYDVATEVALDDVARASAAVEVARDDARAAHAQARAVLDCVSDGLVLVRIDGTLGTERSAALGRYLDADAATVWELFAANPPTADWMQVCWEALHDEFIPMSVALDQLPTTAVVGDRHLRLSWYPQHVDGVLHHVLLVVRDATADLVAEAAQSRHRELVGVFVKLFEDRDAVVDFVAEARVLVGSLQDGASSRTGEARSLHTLKGNSGVLGLDTLSGWIHDLEDRLADEDRRCSADERAEIAHRWDEIESELAPIVADIDSDAIQVRRDDLDAAADLVDRGQAARAAELLRSWKWPSVEPRLHGLAAQARRISFAVGKPAPVVEIATDGVRIVPSDDWRGFWSATVHVLRNALDHGIESPDVREARGKPAEGRLRFGATHRDGALVIEIEDDGAGIDWHAVQRGAHRRGVPAATHADLVEALFAPGVSTREVASVLSGRGVGMGAVRAATEALGGHIEVATTRGEGTTFRFVFPGVAAAAAA